MIHKKLPCRFCGLVFELRADKEPTQFSTTMWEIVALLHIARCKMKQPVFYVSLPPSTKWRREVQAKD